MHFTIRPSFRFIGLRDVIIRMILLDLEESGRVLSHENTKSFMNTTTTGNQLFRLVIIDLAMYCSSYTIASRKSATGI